MNIIHEINLINENFASEGSKLKIEKRGKKLNIRGSLPTKTDNHIFKIQRISLGLNADYSGLKEAKKKLQLVNLQLELDQFNWNNWTSNEYAKNIEHNKEDFNNKVQQFEEFFLKNQKANFYLVPEKRLGRVLICHILKECFLFIKIIKIIKI